MARRTPTPARKSPRSTATSSTGGRSRKKTAPGSTRTTARKSARKTKRTKKTAKASGRAAEKSARKTARKTTRKASRKTARAASAGGRGKSKTAGARTAKKRARKTTPAARASRRTAAGRSTAKQAGKQAATSVPRRPTGRAPARPAPKTKPAPAERGAARRTSEGRAAAPQRPVRRAMPPTTPPDVERTARGVPPVTAAGAADSPERVVLEAEIEEEEDALVPGAPSSLDMDHRARPAEVGAAVDIQNRSEASIDPTIRGGDIDVDFQKAYSSGDEAPGGDNPTPDQDVVELIGRAIGVEYQDNEELKGAEKIVERDRHRWELDPASAEDYKDRSKGRTRS
jgi:hypothetical protein